MNEKIIRDNIWTTVPKKKAIATERKIPSMTERAFSVFRRSLKPIRSMPPASFMSATTNVAPRSSKTIETVVDVGMPRVLKMSSRMMSVTITAIIMQIIS